VQLLQAHGLDMIPQKGAQAAQRATAQTALGVSGA